jgi:hypothetical protein
MFFLCRSVRDVVNGGVLIVLRHVDNRVAVLYHLRRRTMNAEDLEMVIARKGKISGRLE